MSRELFELEGLYFNLYAGRYEHNEKLDYSFLAAEHTRSLEITLTAPIDWDAVRVELIKHVNRCFDEIKQENKYHKGLENDRTKSRDMG